LVFFIIDIETRRVEIANVSHQPHQELMNQIARNLVDDEEGVLREKRYLLCDRDPLYTESFRSILGSGGVEVLRMPARSPNLRPYSERFVRTIKEECLELIDPEEPRGTTAEAVACRKRLGGLLHYRTLLTGAAAQ
jgi:hypothetical protein